MILSGQYAFSELRTALQGQFGMKLNVKTGELSMYYQLFELVVMPDKYIEIYFGLGKIRKRVFRITQH